MDIQLNIQSISPKTLVNIFWQRVKNTPQATAVFYKDKGKYKPVSWAEHGSTVEKAAYGLLKLGMKPGDRLAIISNTRVQWTWADLANLSVGGVTVPVYPTLAGHEIEYLINHSEAYGAVVENRVQLQKLESLANFPASLKFVVVIDGDIPINVNAGKSDSSTGKHGCKYISWQDLLADGEVYGPAHAGTLEKLIQNVRPEDLSSIVYTSGTTGVPKGVMLTHKNIYAVCKSTADLNSYRADDRSLSFLPLSHVYERVGGQFMSIFVGFTVAFAESMDTVASNLAEAQPTVLNGVPRFYEKIYNRITQGVRDLPKPHQYLIRWAFGISKRAAKYNSQSEDKALGAKIYRAELRVADKLVFSRIRQRFGGRLRYMISGAAPLSQEVNRFFDAIGVPILEGYGLTETSAPLACNTPTNHMRGTVGQPLPGVQVKIAEDGEILVKADSVFSGYYKNDEATNAAFKDGWFMTGDIGEINAQGYLSIKDRKKDIIITAGGKHIAPQYLENLFASEDMISHILVYGDKRKFVTALVTLNVEALIAYARGHSIEFLSMKDLIEHPKVNEEVQSIINRKNQRLASFEQIKKFIILDKDFSIEDNELTPTLKVKRKNITQKYKSLLDSMYEHEDLRLENGLLGKVESK